MVDMTSFSYADVQQAKSSQLYKPNMDDTDKGLYQIMNNLGDSQDTTDQYTRAFMSMTTNNVYSGILQNPHTCDIDDTKNDLSSIQSSLNDLYNNGSTVDPNGNTVLNKNNPNWIDAMDKSNPNSIIYQMYNDPYNGTGFADPTNTSLTGDDIIMNDTDTSVSSGLDAFDTHTSRMISNFPSILSMVQGALGIASTVGNLLNPCFGIGDFMGSLLDEGKKVLAKMRSWISKIIDKIQAGLDYALTELKSLVSDALGYVKQAMDWLKKEIKKLVKALILNIKNHISGFLKGLKLDPCAKGILSTITTGAAMALL